MAFCESGWSFRASEVVQSLNRTFVHQQFTQTLFTDFPWSSIWNEKVQTESHRTHLATAKLEKNVVDVPHSTQLRSHRAFTKPCHPVLFMPEGTGENMQSFIVSFSGSKRWNLQLDALLNFGQSQSELCPLSLKPIFFGWPQIVRSILFLSQIWKTDLPQPIHLSLIAGSMSHPTLEEKEFPQRLHLVGVLHSSPPFRRETAGISESPNELPFSRIQSNLQTYFMRASCRGSRKESR